MESPCTPQHQGRARVIQEADALHEHPINVVTDQLGAVTISRPSAAERKRGQTVPTPASQARPRTQRRTLGAAAAAPLHGQENSKPTADEQLQLEQQTSQPCSHPALTAQQHTAVTAANPAAPQGFTPSRLSCISALRDELTCGICLEICVRPCATPCGHNFCRSCLRLALQHKRQCPHCRELLPPPTRWQPKINTALWNTIQLLFPQHAAEAPPPTPPGQVSAAAPAAPAAAAATRQRRTRGTGLQHDDSQEDWEVAAAEAPPRLFGNLNRMAEAVAAEAMARSTADRWPGGALGQPFRPPRSSSWRSRAPLEQQQARNREPQAPPALEPELVTLLRGMRRTQSTAQQAPAQQRSTQQPQAVARQRSRVDPLVEAADRRRWQGLMWQQDEQRPQIQRRTTSHGMQHQRDVEADNLAVELDLDRVLQPGATAVLRSALSTRRVAGQAASLPRRSQRAAAAAATAGAAEPAEQHLLSSDDDELLLQEAMLLSLRPLPTAGGIGNRRYSQHPAAEDSRADAPIQQQQRQETRPSQQSSEVSAVFGRIHSGSSPQQSWADGADPPEPDWQLLDNASQQQQQQQRQEGRQAVPASSQQQILSDTQQGGLPQQGQQHSHSRMGSWRMVTAASASQRQRLRQTGPGAAGAAATAAIRQAAAAAERASSRVSDVIALLDDLEDDVGGPSVTRPRPQAVVGAHNAAGAAAAGGGGGAGSDTAPSRRHRRGVILDVSDGDDDADSSVQGRRQQLSSVAAEHPSGQPSAAITGTRPVPLAAATAAAAMPPLPSTSGRGAGTAGQRNGSRLDAEMRAMLLLSDDEDANSRGGDADGHGSTSVMQPAAAAERPESSTANSAGSGNQDVMDVTVLTLADSPEPQPLLARLARSAPSSSVQQQQHMQGVPSNLFASRLQLPTAEHSAPVGSPGAGELQQQEAAGVAEQAQTRLPHSTADSDEDDFQPPASTRTRMTAARATATIANTARAGGRRVAVVAGMRPPPGRRTTRSRGTA